MTQYESRVSGRCCYCSGKFQRVSAGVNRGMFAFAVVNYHGEERKAHVSCAEYNSVTVTRDFDHYAMAAGTAKKPAQP